MAILLNEPDAEAVSTVIENADGLFISAGTVAEALIVARQRQAGDAMAALIEGLGAIVSPVTQASATHVADAYDRWGKGVHIAGLNFGDCFAYALAKDLNFPLLFVGEDFARTDIKSALAL
jgi:ribonuclease VapC